MPVLIIDIADLKQRKDANAHVCSCVGVFLSNSIVSFFVYKN